MKISREDFEEFIKQLNKKPGEYTEEEYFQIGSLHKKLPDKDKNWNKLAEAVWPGKTGESYRKFTSYRENKESALLQGDYLYEVEENSFDVEEDLNDKLETLYKEKTKVRDLNNSYRRKLRDEARVEAFKEALYSHIPTLNKLPKISYSNQGVDAIKEAVLLISDWHIGVQCDNYYNQFNLNIAVERVNKLVNDTINYCKLNKVSKLTVLNLGDMIQGIIHVNSRIEQQFDLTKQIMTAAELIAQTLNELQKAAPKVIYRSVTDNHSRAIANKKEVIEKENFSKIMDWFIQERLKDTKIEFILEEIDDTFGMFQLLNGKKVVFTHGHLDNINNCFQHYVGATEQFIHYILLGHYHCEKAKSFQGTKVIVNGSLVGTEQYALNNRLFNKPTQTLLIFEDNNLMNISIDLF